MVIRETTEEIELRQPDGLLVLIRFTDRKHAVERIGNSVPLLLMRSIAAHVRELLRAAPR